MNDEDKFELEKRRLSESVRQTVEQEMKRRYSWMGFGLSIIMGSLITLTVDRILKRTEISLAESRAIQKMATENLGAVVLRSEELVKQFELYEKKITGLNEIVASITKQLKQATETNLQYSSGLREEISSLSAVVKIMGGKPSQENVSKIVEENIERIDGRLEKSKVSFEELQKRFQKDIKGVEQQIDFQLKKF